MSATPLTLRPEEKTRPPGRFPRLRNALKVCGLTWACAFALGLFFAVAGAGGFNPLILLLPAVVPVVAIISTAAALPIMPIAVWSSRTGWPNVRRYGPVLWLFLAAYSATVVPSAGKAGLLSLLVIAALGVLALGFVPPRHLASPGNAPAA